MEEFDRDREEVIRRALDLGVEIIVNVGNGDVSKDSHAAAFRVAEEHPFITRTKRACWTTSYTRGSRTGRCTRK
jgi:hypothetical protein